MNTENILSLLGLCARAGKLSKGTHATEFAISSKKARLVVASEDMSEKTVKELKFTADKHNLPVRTLEGITAETLGQRVGKKCGIVAVNDEGFAKALLSKIEGGNANDR